MGPDGEHSDNDDVYYHILTYLTANPDAGDTLEGIVEWWLLDEKIRFELQKVSTVLGRLVSQGLILEHEATDSRRFYKINRAREMEISLILNGLSNVI
ncbi:MAG TPA: hypothetical protein VFC63_03375 [Blastocatellia bacterium]|nr:hypothetical protein [Blastocatellia bacterium]